MDPRDRSPGNLSHGETGDDHPQNSVDKVNFIIREPSSIPDSQNHILSTTPFAETPQFQIPAMQLPPPSPFLSTFPFVNHMPTLMPTPCASSIPSTSHPSVPPQPFNLPFHVGSVPFGGFTSRGVSMEFPAGFGGQPVDSNMQEEPSQRAPSPNPEAAQLQPTSTPIPQPKRRRRSANSAAFRPQGQEVLFEMGTIIIAVHMSLQRLNFG